MPRILAIWMQLAAGAACLTAGQDREKQGRALTDAEMYAALPADATIEYVLPMIRTKDPKTRDMVLKRLAALPELDRSLSELVVDFDEWAGDAELYIALYHPHPGGSLAVAYAKRMLERMEYWRPELEQAPRKAAVHESEMSITVRAAVRIHQAGGNLRAAAQAWIDFLRPYSGLKSLILELDPVARGSSVPARSAR